MLGSVSAGSHWERGNEGEGVKGEGGREGTSSGWSKVVHDHD